MNEQQTMELVEQLTMALNGPEGEEILAGLGVMAGFLSLILAFVGVVYIISVIGQWRIFTKAGDKGWKALIPIYNAYTEIKLVWNTKMFWIIIALGAVGALTNGAEGFLAIIGGLVSLAGTVLTVMEKHKLSRSFGHGVGFTLGLLFLTPVFYLILAFGGSEYIGPEGNRAA